MLFKICSYKKQYLTGVVSLFIQTNTCRKANAVKLTAALQTYCHFAVM